MPFLYYAANPAANLVKIGVSRWRHGAGRLRDYARRHGLPADGWTRPRHFEIATMFAARFAECLAHSVLRLRRYELTPGAREVFRTTPSRAHWAVLRAAQESGAYRPGG